MTHLRDQEFIDLLDGCLEATKLQHVGTCAECRERVADMRALLARAAEAEVPEPSPLFWDQFSSRVREAVAVVEDPAPAGSAFRRAWARHPQLAWPLAAMLVLGVTAIVWRAALDPAERPAPVALSHPGAAVGPALGADTGAVAVEGDIDTDEGWELVRAVAGDLFWEDAPEAGLAARPGSADRLALEMSDDERSALAQLIRDELARRGV
jgi:hypothetical protein